MLDEHDNEPTRRYYPGLIPIAALVAGVAVLGANGWLLHLAAQDHSWGALYILVIAGPVTNGVIAVVGLVSSFVLRWLGGGAPVASFLYTGVLLPVVAIFFDAVAILCMGPHGC
jgi:hypothetical protein